MRSTQHDLLTLVFVGFVLPCTTLCEQNKAKPAIKFVSREVSLEKVVEGTVGSSLVINPDGSSTYDEEVKYVADEYEISFGYAEKCYEFRHYVTERNSSDRGWRAVSVDRALMTGWRLTPEKLTFLEEGPTYHRIQYRGFEYHVLKLEPPEIQSGCAALPDYCVGISTSVSPSVRTS